MALSAACVAAPVQIVVGDWAAREVAARQPVKLAAFEGLQKTTKGAPINVGGLYDEGERRVRGGVEIPKLLSLLAFHDPNAPVRGLDSVPEDDRPPVDSSPPRPHAARGGPGRTPGGGAWLSCRWR